VDFVAPLLAGALLPSRDDQGVALGGGDRRDMDLAQGDSNHCSHRQRRRKDLAAGHCQADLVVIRPPGRRDPTQVGSLVLLWCFSGASLVLLWYSCDNGSRCGGRWAPQLLPLSLGAAGQAQLPRGHDGERLILPDHRLVSFGVVRIGRLNASALGHLLLAQRPHTLAAQRVLRALGRLLQLRGREPLPLGGYWFHTLLWRGSGLPLLFLLSPANTHDAPVARPLLEWAVRLYAVRPRIIRLDAGYWGLRLIAWIHCVLGATAVISWNPKRQKNRSQLPPTWTADELGKRSSIERFFGRVFSLFSVFRLQRPPLCGWSAVATQAALVYATSTVVGLAAQQANRQDLIRSPQRVLAHLWEAVP